jgi:hypothetical protein
MSDTFESIYPDFLRSGLGKLSELDSRRELLTLFSALEHFRHDLHHQEAGVGILDVTHRYVTGLNLFHSMGFWLVNPEDMSFILTLASPEGECAILQKTVDEQVKNGRPCALHSGGRDVLRLAAPGGGAGPGSGLQPALTVARGMRRRVGDPAQDPPTHKSGRNPLRIAATLRLVQKGSQR